MEFSFFAKLMNPKALVRNSPLGSRNNRKQSRRRLQTAAYMSQGGQQLCEILFFGIKMEIATLQFLIN